MHGRILIISPPFLGHINPTLAVGQTLIDQGFDVTWVTNAPINGAEFPVKGKVIFTDKDDPEVAQRLAMVQEGKRRGVIEGLKFIFEEAIFPLNVKLFQGLKLLQDDFDLVIHDEQAYSGAAFAFQRQIPFVTSYTAPPNILEELSTNHVDSWFFSLQQSFLEEIEIHRAPLSSKDLGIVFCPKHFDHPHQLLEHQHFVGPCIDVARPTSVSIEKSMLEKEEKKILVSIGSLLKQEAVRFFKLIIDDFGDSPYRLFVSANPDIQEKWPDNFYVNPRLPQLELLKHVDLVISHGGANTVCESIGNARPLLVIPMAFDQYHMANQVEGLKLGKRLRYKRLHPGTMIKTTREILEDSDISKNVKVKSDEFRQAGGASKAADLIISYLENIHEIAFETKI